MSVPPSDSQDAARFAQARKMLRRIEKRRFDHMLGLDRLCLDWSREPEVIEEWLRWCGPEILEAVGGDPLGCALCDLWLVSVPGGRQCLLVGELAPIRTGLRRAIRVLIDDRRADVGAHVRGCVAAVLAEAREVASARIRKLSAEELLSVVLNVQRSDTERELYSLVPNSGRRLAAAVMDCMTPRQRGALLSLAVGRLEVRKLPERWAIDLSSRAIHKIPVGTDDAACDDSPAVPLSLAHEPSNDLLWVAWYLLKKIDAELKGKGIERQNPETPVIVYMDLTKKTGRRSKKTGELKDIGGPAHARAFQALERELNKHGQPIPNPGSISRVARHALGGKSRGVAERYLEGDLPGWSQSPERTAAGEVGVRIVFTPETLRAQADIVKGNKRGP